MKIKIFYSWQSDLPNKTNRGFILKSLQNVANSLQADENIRCESVIVDRDTEGVTGTPNIIETILNKIDNSDIFVADVSIINKDSQNRLTPNPNVLIELGYALKSLGHDRVVTLMNTAYSEPEQLPFDLKQRRVTIYNLSEDAKNKSQEKKELESKLKYTILSIINEISNKITQSDSVKEKVLFSINNQTPDRDVEIEHYMNLIVERMDRINPDFSKAHEAGNHLDNALIEAIESDENIFLIRDYLETIKRAVEMKDIFSLNALLRKFELLTDKYILPSGHEGSYRETDFDYYRFTGYFLFVSTIALILKSEQWDILKNLINIDYLYRKDFVGKKDLGNYFHISAPLRLFYIRKERLKSNRISLLFDEIEWLFSNTTISDFLTFEDFQSADYLLFLYSEAENFPNRDSLINWYPYSLVVYRNAPRFLIAAQKKSFAKWLQNLLSLNTVDDLKNFFKYVNRRLHQAHGPYADTFNFNIDKIGSIDK